jgi:hypothetical protein
MLPDLEQINASWNVIHDLAPLAGLPRLRKVVVSLTAVADLTPLAAGLMQSPGAAPQTSVFGWFWGPPPPKPTKKTLGAASPPRTPPPEADFATALPLAEHPGLNNTSREYNTVVMYYLNDRSVATA